MTSKTAPRRFESVSSGPKTRKFRWSSFSVGHVAEELAEHQGVLGFYCAGGGHVHRVGPEIGHPQVAEQDAAVGVRVGAHPPLPLGREIGELGPQPARLIE